MAFQHVKAIQKNGNVPFPVVVFFPRGRTGIVGFGVPDTDGVTVRDCDGDRFGVHNTDGVTVRDCDGDGFGVPDTDGVTDRDCDGVAVRDCDGVAVVTFGVPDIERVIVELPDIDVGS